MKSLLFTLLMLVSLATKLSAQVVTQEADAYNNLDSLLTDDTTLTEDLTSPDVDATVSVEEEDMDLEDSDDTDDTGASLK